MPSWWFIVAGIAFAYILIGFLLGVFTRHEIDDDERVFFIVTMTVLWPDALLYVYNERKKAGADGRIRTDDT